MIAPGNAYAVYDADTNDQVSSEMTRDEAYQWLGDAAGEISEGYADLNLVVRLADAEEVG